jgi:CheY-like chemotaxis protein
MIFIVDDDPSVRSSLTRLLRAERYAVRAFPSGEACLEDLNALDATGATVRCVILDVHMPGMRPSDLQDDLNRRDPPLPVIVLTAADDAEMRAVAAAAGVSAVLRKPCEPAVLLRAVTDAIAHSTATVAAPAGTSASRGPDGDDPDNFVVEAGRGLYRPVGSVSFDAVVALVRDALAAARRHRLQVLLVDTTALTGFPSPDTFERFLAAVEWAAEAGPGVRLAMVAPPAMMHPQRFGVLVAANRGLTSNIFATETEARAWLAAGDGV